MMSVSLSLSLSFSFDVDVLQQFLGGFRAPSLCLSCVFLSFQPIPPQKTKNICKSPLDVVSHTIE
jgi:hypothetical protein